MNTFEANTSLLATSAIEVIQKITEMTLVFAPNTLPNASFEIGLAIPFQGPINGVFVLQLDTNLAISLTHAILKNDPTELSEEVWDVSGELFNIIIGKFKALLGNAVFSYFSPPIRCRTIAEIHALTEKKEPLLSLILKNSQNHLMVIRTYMKPTA